MNGTWLHGADAWVDRAIAQAYAWCDAQLDADPKSPLRTASFCDVDDFVKAGVNLDRLVLEVVKRRASALGANAATAPEKPQPRLVVTFVDRTLSDGAAEAESQWFFDWNNFAPFNTWVGMVSVPTEGRGLVAIVPERLVERVQGGIDVVPEECIHWIDRHTLALRLR